MLFPILSLVIAGTYSESGLLGLAWGRGRSLAKRADIVPVRTGLNQRQQGPNSPIYPACHLPVLFSLTRIRNLVVLIVPVHEILQDGTALPDFELLAVLVRVNDGRDATIGVDVEVPLLFLLMFKELDWVHLYAELC